MCINQVHYPELVPLPTGMSILENFECDERFSANTEILMSLRIFSDISEMTSLNILSDYWNF